MSRTASYRTGLSALVVNRWPIFFPHRLPICIHEIIVLDCPRQPFIGRYDVYSNNNTRLLIVTGFYVTRVDIFSYKENFFTTWDLFRDNYRSTLFFNYLQIRTIIIVNNNFSFSFFFNYRTPYNKLLLSYFVILKQSSHPLILLINVDYTIALLALLSFKHTRKASIVKGKK